MVKQDVNEAARWHLSRLHFRGKVSISTVQHLSATGQHIVFTGCSVFG
jgi:hypothetical protein